KALALGADYGINHYKQKISEEVRKITNKEGVDIVIEHVGAATWEESIKSLKPAGTLVTCGATTGPNVGLELRFVYSRQLSIIGINRYKTAPPLSYAVSDATAIAAALSDRFLFPQNNIHLLLESNATRAAILEQFLSFACEGTEVNDRLIVFFAGHGHTVKSSRGEVGYLVPWDGDCGKLASLIRWDELTRNADLIEAKHIL